MSGKQRLRLLIPLVLLSLSCESEYSKLMKAELAKDVRYDSLFFGIELGQDKKEYFEICWDWHKKGVLGSSGRSNYVQYDMVSKDTFPKVLMHFYPETDAYNKISEMDVLFDYSAWGPWSKTYGSEALLPVVLDTLQSWYKGNKFLNVELDNKEDVWIKVDGNRRIAVRVKDERYVQAKITDLLNESTK